MKIKELSIGVSRTFNLGSYESLRVEAGMSASLETGADDEIEETRAKLLDEVGKTLAKTFHASKPKKEKPA